ncbi:MAG: hypothetical protein ACO1SV_16170 [Fimbriimonas sp.]
MVRNEMYNEVFSDVQGPTEAMRESTPYEGERDLYETATETDGRRFRVLTPRQRARLMEPSPSLYLG